jgi:hypothetical protein
LDRIERKERSNIVGIDSHRESEFSRRKLLLNAAAVSLGLPLAGASTLPILNQNAQQVEPVRPHTRPAEPPTPTSLTPEDDQFLDQLERANFLFFWEQSNPPTGLTKDRCNIRTKDTSLAASIASTGFALTAICIGEKRGYVSYADARLRVVQALSFLPLCKHQDRRKNVGF